MTASTKLRSNNDRCGRYATRTESDVALIVGGVFMIGAAVGTTTGPEFGGTFPVNISEVHAVLLKSTHSPNTSAN